MKLLARLPLHQKIIYICITVLLVTVLAVANNSCSSTDYDYVRFIDTPGGECAIIHSRGHFALIDTGSSLGSVATLKAVREAKIKNFDAVILTSASESHIGGAPAVLAEIPTDNVVLPHLSAGVSDITLDFVKEKAESVGAVCHKAQAGMVIEIGDFSLTVLQADNSGDSVNNASTVIMAENDGRKILFTGNIEAEAEQRLQDRGINFNCDILKVANSGGKNSTTQGFLNIASPIYSVVSGDSIADRVALRLRSIGSKIYKLEDSGNLTFKVEDGNIVLEYVKV